MVYSVHNQLFNKIIEKGKGELLFPADFIELGGSDAIRKGLSRLVKEKIIVRLGQGIYLYPKYDPELGILYPPAEKIAEAIANRDKARIIPTGVQALYKLGLSTQIPMRIVYLTDGAPRKIKVGNNIITFKITTPKKFAIEGKISGLVIQALQELGKKQVDEKVINRLKKALQYEDKEILRHDAKLAPTWIADLLFKMLKELKNDRMAKID